MCCRVRLLEFGEGTTPGFNQVAISEVLEELLLEEGPILRPGGRILIVFEIEGGSNPREGGVLEGGR